MCLTLMWEINAKMKPNTRTHLHPPPLVRHLSPELHQSLSSDGILPLLSQPIIITGSSHNNFYYKFHKNHTKGGKWSDGILPTPSVHLLFRTRRFGALVVLNLLGKGILSVPRDFVPTKSQTSQPNSSCKDSDYSKINTLCSSFGSTLRGSKRIREEVVYLFASGDKSLTKKPNQSNKEFKFTRGKDQELEFFMTRTMIKMNMSQIKSNHNGNVKRAREEEVISCANEGFSFSKKRSRTNEDKKVAIRTVASDISSKDPHIAKVASVFNTQKEFEEAILKQDQNQTIISSSSNSLSREQELTKDDVKERTFLIKDWVQSAPFYIEEHNNKSKMKMMEEQGPPASPPAPSMGIIIRVPDSEDVDEFFNTNQFLQGISHSNDDVEQQDFGEDKDVFIDNTRWVSYHKEWTNFITMFKEHMSYFFHWGSKEDKEMMEAMENQADFSLDGSDCSEWDFKDSDFEDAYGDPDISENGQQSSPFSELVFFQPLFLQLGNKIRVLEVLYHDSNFKEWKSLQWTTQFACLQSFGGRKRKPRPFDIAIDLNEDNPSGVHGADQTA